MAAGHWDSCNGIVRYASATSRVAACDPSGRRAISKNMVENFPHVHGSRSVVKALLMDGLGKRCEVWMGNEKFCTKRNLPNLPGLGINESGDDWNGPIAASIAVKGRGPM